MEKRSLKHVEAQVRMVMEALGQASLQAQPEPVEINLSATAVDLVPAGDDAAEAPDSRGNDHGERPAAAADLESRFTLPQDSKAEAVVDEIRNRTMMPAIYLEDDKFLARLDVKDKEKGDGLFTSKSSNSAVKKSEQGQQRLFEKIVNSEAFVNFFCLAILSNVVLMGAEADAEAVAALTVPPTEPPAAYYVVNVIFLILFSIEIVLRVIAEGPREFLCGHHKAWNAFDSFLVVTSALEVIAVSSAFSGIRVLRLLRLVRTLRIIRVFQIFRDLRMMVVCVFNSFAALSWAIVLLFTVTYIFALIVMQGVSAYMRDGEFVPDPQNPFLIIGPEELAGAYQIDNFSHDGLRQQFLLHFPTLLRTILALFMCVTGGMDWYQLMKPLMNIGEFYAFACLVYVSFTIFCVMNVLSAVFVEAALDMKDRDLIIQAELAKVDAFLADMSELFEEADNDNLGTITKDEFLEYMKSERVAAYFINQGLDVTDVGLMFDLLDNTGDGSIGKSEFLLGTLRLKGQARNIEIMRLFQALDHLRAELAMIQTRLGLMPAAFPAELKDGVVDRKTKRLSAIPSPPTTPTDPHNGPAH
eukprot:TRINITY_DN76082_c0_g1_i1.p1 TRINITY_DN76082_c0_g1~~TRINITY_DN76082_c0_g1_i1.p1  ORF type:complete len:667 (-),score=142.21 TRINITY_DN76082_c0_g1_i1:111-1862(-)